MMALSNGNITLRALEPTDVELLYLWENDTNTWRVSNNHAPISKFILANYIKNSDRDIWESRELRLVIENSASKPVGTIDLFDFDPYHSRAGIGLLIYEPGERRQGIAKQAFELMCEYVKTEVGIAQLYVNIAQSNQASLQMFLKLDFEICATKKHWLRTPTGWETELMLQKLL